MKILVLNYEYPPLGGGGGKQSMYLAREYAKSNEVYFLTSGYGEFGIKKEKNLTLHLLKTMRKRADRCTSTEMADYVFRAWNVLPSITKGFRPDAVHVFFTLPTGALIFHPSLRKIPYVVSVRGSDVPGHNPSRFRLLYKLFRPIIKKIWKNAKAVVANSEDLKKEILGISPELDVTVIPNGIDSKKFSPPQKKKKERGENKAEKGRMLYAGRLIPLKRIDRLLECSKNLLLDNEKEIYLRIVGSGEEENSLKEQASRLGIINKVEFAGSVPYSRIEKEYQEADIYIQLSETEGMSNTIVEAMACGLPIITTDVGGASGFIKGNGFLVPKDDLSGVESMILQLYENPVLRKKMGEKSREIALKMGFSESAKRYLEILR